MCVAGHSTESRRLLVAQHVIEYINDDLEFPQESHQERLRRDPKITRYVDVLTNAKFYSFRQ